MYREMIENRDKVARFSALRLRRENAALGGAPVLEKLIARAVAAPGGADSEAFFRELAAAG